MCRFKKFFFCALYFSSIWALHGNATNTFDSVNDILNPIQEDFTVWHQRNARVAIRNNEELDCERPNFYLCELPPTLVSSDVRKSCDYRNRQYHEQVYRWVAGRGCLVYTPPFLYKAGYNNFNLSAGCYFGNLFAPCLEMAKEDGKCGCFPFDPGFEEVAVAVREALIPSAQERWERCFYSASDCCSHYMNENTTSSEGQCGTTFDAWTCWQPAAAGTIANEVCSEFAYSNTGPTCDHYSSKECYNNSTWEVETVYSTCSVSPRLTRRYNYHIGMLSFSIASCLPAIIIFFAYKRLRITRIALHRNLLIAIVVRNVLVIISRSTIYIPEITNSGDTALSDNGIGCRILSVAERIAGNAVFVCMLVEGIYLHRLIAAVFKKQLNVKWLYVAGAFIATIPVAAWAAVMGVYNNHSCWVIFTVANIQWILDAPRIAILLVNTILFVDVLRILLTKIRNSENANQLSTAKTTLFLMPIFGTQFLLTAFRPNTTNCMSEQAYYYIAYTVEGLQGAIVATLYCYINKEVRMLLKATYIKTESAVVSRVRNDNNYPRMSVDPRSNRRFTYSTAVHSQDDNKDVAGVPKLHVAEIISIQPIEKLANILEPVYETIEDGVINEGYDSLERSSADNDSRFISNRDSKIDNNYYNFTNVSSVSIDCQDWIKGISSPSSSIYNSSLNDYETRYPERKNPIHPNLKEYPKKRLSLQDNIKNSDKIQDTDGNDDKNDTSVVYDATTEVINESDYEDYDNNMLHEIMQYMETNDSTPVKLNPTALSPNRTDDDKIIFVDD